MLYNQNDLKILKDEIEFVDTAVIPFASSDMNVHASLNSSNIEMLQLVSMQLEKQFKGRLLITPMMTTVDENISVLASYAKQLRTYGFKNIVVLTHLKAEIDDAHRIKLNEIPLENMSNEMKIEMINEEVKTVMKSVISIWNK